MNPIAYEFCLLYMRIYSNPPPPPPQNRASWGKAKWHGIEGGGGGGGGHGIRGASIGVLQCTEKNEQRMVARYSAGHSIRRASIGVFLLYII